MIKYFCDRCKKEVQEMELSDIDFSNFYVKPLMLELYKYIQKRNIKSATQKPDEASFELGYKQAMIEIEEWAKYHLKNDQIISNGYSNALHDLLDLIKEKYGKTK